MVSKFNEKIKFKLISFWFKYVDIKILYNYNSFTLYPQRIPFLTHVVKIIALYLGAKWIFFKIKHYEHQFCFKK
jgi:hypothetical protein